MDESEPLCCATPRGSRSHSMSRDTKDGMTPGSARFGLSFIRDLGVAVTLLWQSPSESKVNPLQRAARSHSGSS